MLQYGVLSFDFMCKFGSASLGLARNVLVWRFLYKLKQPQIFKFQICGRDLVMYLGKCGIYDLHYT
jgi:hypothetical protein